MQLVQPIPGRPTAGAVVLAPSYDAGRACLWTLAGLLGGCSGPQSTLDPRGPQAAAIAELWWIMLTGATVLLFAVVALALYAALRDPARRRRIDGRVLIIGGGVLLPTVVLGALLVAGTHAGGLLVARDGAAPLRIEVEGRQWWWQVRYPDAPQAFVGANELRVPVGRTVEIALSSGDVIHSFWVPRLAGKTDLIPGRINRIRLRADQVGAYPGQCAEFCGRLHAHMRFVVVAVEPAAFERWLATRAQPVAMHDQVAMHAFESRGCSGCHSIRGWRTANGGPDLSAFGARMRGIDGAALADWLQHRHPQQLSAPGRTFAATEIASDGARSDEQAALPSERRIEVPSADEAERLAGWLETLQ